jgi:hypothetical protein
MNSFPGGIGQIEIANNEDFRTGTELLSEATAAYVLEDVSLIDNDFALSVGRSSIAEGTEVPAPERVTAALADDREVAMGKDQPISIRLTQLPRGDFNRLDTAGERGRNMWVRVSSMRTDASGNPLYEVTYGQVILSHVAHGPARADRESYGLVVVDGIASAASADSLYDLIT